MKSKKLEDAICNSMASPTFKNAFVIGCFEKRITIYSQQIRALNLVWALCNSGRVTKDSKVCIIGGGISGITVAAGLLLKLDCKIELFEKDRLLHFQKGSKERYIHPNLYDWPNGEYNTDYTDLPFFNWRAGSPDSIVSKIEQEWHQLLISNDLNKKVRIIKANVLFCKQQKNRIDVCFLKPGKTREYNEFDVVIYAGGFGPEKKDRTAY